MDVQEECIPVSQRHVIGLLNSSYFSEYLIRVRISRILIKSVKFTLRMSTHVTEAFKQIVPVVRIRFLIKLAFGTL